METKILKNVRFRHLYAELTDWEGINPIVLSGELALVKVNNDCTKIKVGIGSSFKDTPWMYSMDRWTSNYKTLSAAADANIKPSDAKGYNTEDFLQISGDLIYPINLTTSVRLKDGTKLQTWMDNVNTGHVTMTGNLRVNRTVGGERDILKVVSDDVYGTSIALGSGGNTVVSSGEADVLISPLLNPNSEQLYLASDLSIFLYTKCQTADTMRNIVFNGDALYPGSNNNIDLGASSYRWSHIYTYSIDVDNVFSARHVNLKTNNTTDIKGIGGLIGNDYWRVGGALSDADNVDSGYMEIATADNGTEPIYARQYIGGFTTLVRTLTLLDASGNSLFPGSISEKGVTLENKYLQRSGALPMTGTLDMGMHHSIRFRVNSNGSSAVGNVFRNSDDSTFGGIGMYGSNGVAEHIYIGLGASPWETGSGISISATQFKYKNNTIWHAGNDGANSGLDADLLDGKHASAFSLTSHTHSYAGSASVGGPANSALKLQTARKIGNASFDGTADITIAQMGVSPEAGSDKLSKLAQTITLGYGSNATILQDNGQYRQKIEISDLATDTSSVFTFSRSTDSGVNWTELFSVLGNGTISAKQFTGNSVSASKLQTVRKIGNANFDGTANITVEQIGAAPTVHTHITLEPVVLTSSTESTANKYVKIAECKIKERYGFIATTFECITGGHGQDKNDYFRLNIWIKQQDEFGKDPYVYISSSGRDTSTKMAKFYIQITEKASTYSKVSIYAKILSTYTMLRMFRLSNSSGSSETIYTQDEAFIESLPESGKIVEEVDCTGKHVHTKSQITDFPTSLKNPTNLVVKLNGGTTEGTNLFTYDGSISKILDITPDTIGARPVGAILLENSCDLNDMIAEGEYYAIGGNVVKNRPENIDGFGLRVQRTADGYCCQILYVANNNPNKIFVRTCTSRVGKTWTGWDMLYSTRYKPTPTDVGAAPAVHTHPYLPLAGGNMTGNIGMKVKSNPTTGAASSTYFIDPTSTEVRGGFGTYFANDKFMYLYIGTGSEAWRSANALTISETGIAFHDNKVWHAGNDGAGSGLDADTVDGLQATAFAKASHTHTKAQITDFPVSLKNPNALTISLNGTSQGAYDGSAAKSINITPAGIGAAAASHTHTKAQITDFPTTLPNAGALTISLNGTSQGAYDGSAAKSINITPAGIGAATAGHTHNYAGSSSVGGNANAAVKLTTARKIGNALFDGTADITVAAIGAAAAGHTHNYAGSSSAGGNANAAVKLATARKIGNASFDGTADITVAAIGAAAASHTHSYLPLSGGTVTGSITSSLVTNTYLEGNKGKAIINSSAEANKYVMLAKLNSTNGYFTDGVYQDKRLFQYTPKTTVDAGTNSVAKSVTILNEAGNSIFPGTVTAPTFSGSLSGTASAATKLATARKIGNIAFDGTADITIAQIGAAAASHTHTKAQITDFPTSLKNPTALTISLNGTSQGAYDGSAAKAINITAASIGAAVISHTHNYAGSSSAGGNANAAVKLATARKIGNASFDGTANITAAQMGVAPSNLIYKNITIATSAWNTTTKIYEYANASITANHVPQVFFNNATLDAAGKAGIIVYTEAGKLVLKCTTIPTASLVIETAILTPV